MTQVVIVIQRCVFFFSSRRRHTRCLSDWSSDVCSSDLAILLGYAERYAKYALTPRTGIFPGPWREGVLRVTLRVAQKDGAQRLIAAALDAAQIGRASCRERV